MISPESLSENYAMPMPEQLFAIQNVVAGLAKEQEKFKPSKRSAQAYLLYPQEVELKHVVNEQGELELYSMHRFAGVVARTGFQRWRMRMLEGRWTRQLSENSVIGYALDYTFEWGSSRVTKARRNTHVISKKGESSVQTTINRGGCESLLKSIKMFRDASRQAYWLNLRPAIDRHMLDLLLADYEGTA